MDKDQNPKFKKRNNYDRLIELLATLYFPLEIKMLWLNRACAP
jgi:hypothetical protein